MDAKQLARLVEMFKTEAREHLAVLNRHLLTLERLTDSGEKAALLEEIFRAAHSLKGAARTVGFQQVETLAHDMEAVFGAARNGEIELNAHICDVLYATLDAIETLLNTAAAGSETPLDVSELTGRLEGALNGKAVKVLPSLSETPVAVEFAKPFPEPVSANPASEDTIRVNISKLEALMAQAGELLVFKISAEQRLADLKKLRKGLRRQRKDWRKHSHAQPEYWQRASHMMMGELLNELTTLEHSLANDTVRMNMVIDNLQDEIRQARMLPFSTITPGFERLVRDVAHQLGKNVVLHLRGEALEVDKKILEEVRDPIMHLIRNAVDHGIEMPEERGHKPAPSILHLNFSQSGNFITITVKDDGRGIDLEAVKAAAIESGAISAADAARLSPSEIAHLILLPGLSTNSHITTISGRGVGLDVVRHQLESLHGQISIETIPGLGTTFQLIVPLTLATTHSLMVRIGEETYALPLASVVKIVTLRREDIHSINGREVISVNKQPVALVRLAELLKLPAPPVNLDSRIKAVLVRSAETQVAFVVDELVGEQEMVIKSLGKQLQRIRNITGATLLGNGEVMMILNPAELIRTAQGAPTVQIFAAAPKEENLIEQTILVVDDSITTRTLEKNILEAAGYHVITAMDGAEALRFLHNNPCDLVVSDVQMPQMDGLELARAVKSSNTLNHLPLILVTSLESQTDRERGLAAGANAYIVKRGFDQADLLATIRQLI